MWTPDYIAEDVKGALEGIHDSFFYFNFASKLIRQSFSFKSFFSFFLIFLFLHFCEE